MAGAPVKTKKVLLDIRITYNACGIPLFHFLPLGDIDFCENTAVISNFVKYFAFKIPLKVSLIKNKGVLVFFGNII